MNPLADEPGIGIAAPRHRLPGSIRLGPVRLQVSDLNRSIAFYDEVLGFRPMHRNDERAVLGPHSDNRPILELVELAGANRVPRRGLLGLFHAAFVLPDRASLARFLRHVGSRGIPIGMSDHLVSEAIYLNDPDGLGLEVYADRPRDEWQTAGQEIRMATEPLDVADLLRAAGDEAWSGAPAGTHVGHVHLHVGDLARAEAFYHDALGLDKVVWSYPGALFLSAGGYHHHLGINTWASGARPAGPDDARLLEWTINLPNSAQLRATAGSLTSAGFNVSEDGASFSVADPWGTVVRIQSD